MDRRSAAPPSPFFFFVRDLGGVVANVAAASPSLPAFFAREPGDPAGAAAAAALMAPGRIEEPSRGRRCHAAQRVDSRAPVKLSEAGGDAPSQMAMVHRPWPAPGDGLPGAPPRPLFALVAIQSAATSWTGLSGCWAVILT